MVDLMNSMLVTPGKLIDALITVDIKLYFAMEALGEVGSLDYNKEKLEEIGKKVTVLNKKRHRLINEIDENFQKWLEGRTSYPFCPEEKTY